MATVVDELVTILGVKLAADAMGKLMGFKDSVSGVAKSITALGVVVTGAATAAGMFINRTLEQANELDKLASSTGLSTDALQEWSYAAQRTGGDAKAVQNDIAALGKKFMTTGENAEKMLMNMSDSFSKMTLAQAKIRGGFFGLSDDTVRLLHKGREGVEELRKEAHKLGGIIPAEAIKRAADFKRSLAELQFAIRGITSQVAIATVPALEKVVTKIKEFIALNREWISLGLEAIFLGLVNGVERFFALLVKGASFFDTFIDMIRQFIPDMEGAEFVTHLVTGALSGLLLVFAPLLAKMVAVGIALGAVVFAFEDLFTYLEGGESVIGHFFEAFEERWPDLYQLLKNIGTWIKEHVVDGFNTAKDVALLVVDAFSDVATHVLDSLNAISAPLSEFFDTFETKFPSLAKALKAFAEVVKTTVVGAFKLLIDIIKTAVTVIFDILDGVGYAVNKVAEFGDWLAEKFGIGEPSESKESPKKPLYYFESKAEEAERRKQELSSAPVSSEKRRSTEVVDFFDMIPQALESINSAQNGVREAGSASNAPTHATTNYNDNKTVTIQLATNDPEQAAMQIERTLQQSNTNTPGQYAPIAH